MVFLIGTLFLGSSVGLRYVQHPGLIRSSGFLGRTLNSDALPFQSELPGTIARFGLLPGLLGIRFLLLDSQPLLPLRELRHGLRFFLLHLLALYSLLRPHAR